MTEWTEAIALDRFFDETVYVTICQSMKIDNNLTYKDEISSFNKIER